jgi:hypothetical protein
MPWRIFKTALLLSGLITVTACSATVDPSLWQVLKLGGFSLSVPASMTLLAGGIDSQAGTLEDKSHQLSYDFGAYSDPLTSPDGATALTERAGLVNGLPARFVSFRKVGPTGSPQACEGVHVPLIRKSAIGSIKLTLLLCGDTETARPVAGRIFQSVKFHAANSR